jgi:hypothetical protein
MEEIGTAKVCNEQADGQTRTGQHPPNGNETRQPIQSVADVDEGKTVTAADEPFVGQLLPIELEVYLLSFLNEKDFVSASCLS